MLKGQCGGVEVSWVVIDGVQLAERHGVACGLQHASDVLLGHLAAPRLTPQGQHHLHLRPHLTVLHLYHLQGIQDGTGSDIWIQFDTGNNKGRDTKLPFLLN